MPMCKVCILLADDHEMMRRGARAVLESHGNFVIYEAENGAEAVEKSREFKPDLVILDISMPKLDGFSAAREIRALNPDVPIIIFSLNRTELFSEIAERIGVSGYVTKSDGSQAFLSAVDAALSANSVPKT
jgi:DNA-binding NarL/FixJ family response regulator